MLQVNITGDGKVTATGINCGSDCQEEYVENTFVTLNATPNSGSIFTGWSDTCSGKVSICQVTMKDFYTISAYFEVIKTPEIPLTEEVVSSNGDLEFIGLQSFYQVGEIVKLDLAEHITIEPVYSRLDLWIGLEDPNGLRYYMTELPLQPFSFHPQSFRNGITDYELLTKDAIYPLLYFEVPPGIGGEYKFFAVLSEADTGLNDLLFTQNSSTLTAKTTLGNTINPSVLPYPPERLTMFIGEDLELTIDSETTFDAVLNSCTILDTTIVQTYSAISDINNTVSCYLRALNSGQTVLTTTDRYGNLSETMIVVIEQTNN